MRDVALRRFAAAATLACLLVGGASAPHAAGAAARERRVTIEYTGPSGIYSSTGGVSVWGSIGPSYEFRALKGERYLSMRATDDNWSVVAVEIAYKSDPASGWFFCGETLRPLRIRPGRAFLITVLNTTCPSGEPSIPTTGTIEVTASGSG